MIQKLVTTGDHLLELLAQPGLEDISSFVKPEHAPNIERMPNCFTFVDAYGMILGCMGVIDIWQDRAEAWAIFSPKAGPNLVAIHREVKRFLDAYPSKRIEATTECNFERGHRWLRMLGFSLEAPCLAQYREGQDHALYSIVKK